MQQTKAVLKFIDAAGRMVCLTETNEAALVYLKFGDIIPIVGGEVMLERIDDGKHRRVTDWSIVQ